MNDKARRLLENYRSYVFALQGYEKAEEIPSTLDYRYQSAAPCRMTAYSETPTGTGSGSRPPYLTGGWKLEDHLEYNAYKYAVSRIECAVELLSVIEREIITKKYMDGLTLERIGTQHVPSHSREWAKFHHRRAIQKLEIAFVFDEVPHIVKTDNLTVSCP